jgi:hypothetical protein
MTTRSTGLALRLPLQFLAAWLAVWLGRVLQEQVDFLQAENRLLREKLGGKRIRLTDAERRRPATLGKKLGGTGLAAVARSPRPRRSCAGIANWLGRIGEERGSPIAPNAIGPYHQGEGNRGSGDG